MAVLSENYEIQMPEININFTGGDQTPISSPWTYFNIFGGSNPVGLKQKNGGWSPSGANTTAQAGWALLLGHKWANDQSVSAKIQAIAPPLAVVSISAALVAGSSTIYTYSFVSGTPLFIGMDIVIAGMQNSGNDFDAIITGLGAGTFTVTNPFSSGVNEVGSSGIGIASSDSLCGLVVRGSADGLNGYFTLIGTNNAKIGGAQGIHPGTDSRVYTIELWYMLNGTSTFVSAVEPIPTTVPDSIGDTYTLSAVGTTITLSKNGGAPIFTHTDMVGIFGGSPGIVAQSLSNASPTVGNDGTVWGDWNGSDSSKEALVGWIPRAFDVFEGTQGLNTPPWSAASHFAALASGGSGVCTNGSGLWTQRSWANDHASQYVLSAASGNTSIDIIVRSDATGANSYVGAITFTNGFASGGTLALAKAISGSFAALTSYSIGAEVGVPISSAVLQPGAVFRLEVRGTTLTLYVNGVVYIQGTDASLASGTPGFLTNGSTTSLSNWQGDEYVSAISGNAGVAGATVSYSGTASGSVVADGSGNYTIPLSNGTYTVTPSLAGYTFSPPNASGVVVASDAVVQNFTAAPNGDTYNPSIAFIGSVRVVASAPASVSDPFLGKMLVLVSPPVGTPVPYLGQIREVAVAPPGEGNPVLGQVVVVVSAPIGDSDPYLGSVENE